jgi:hypothetical protein
LVTTQKRKEQEAVISSGQVWRYCDVPRTVYKELLASSSKGSYMQFCIIGAQNIGCAGDETGVAER